MSDRSKGARSRVDQLKHKSYSSDVTSVLQQPANQRNGVLINRAIGERCREPTQRTWPLAINRASGGDRRMIALVLFAAILLC